METKLKIKLYKIPLKLINDEMLGALDDGHY